jgi:hypothetical protein
MRLRSTPSPEVLPHQRYFPVSDPSDGAYNGPWLACTDRAYYHLTKFKGSTHFMRIIRQLA